MTHKNLKISAVGIGLLLLGVTAFFLSGFNYTHASTTDNLSGWAWSSNIGWISLNCTNESVCGSSPYGINVVADGSFSGYAWSSNIGWISFNSADVSGCPSGSCAPAFDKTTGILSGWARACGATATAPSGCSGQGSDTGDWTGWIHLSGTAQDGSAYGMTASGCNWGGYSWGGEDIVGAIHWSGSGYGVVGTGDACTSNPTPPSASINADSKSPTDNIDSSATAVITWSCTNADVKCSVDANGAATGWSGTSAGGNHSVSMTGPATITYTVTAKGSGGPDATQSVTVNWSAPIGGGGPPTVTLTASPTFITVGGSTNLHWTISGADICAFTTNKVTDSSDPVWEGHDSDAPVNTTAAGRDQSVSPRGTITYTLTCTSNAGADHASATARVTVSVIKEGGP